MFYAATRKIGEKIFPIANVIAAEPNPTRITSRIFLLIERFVEIAIMKPVSETERHAIRREEHGWDYGRAEGIGF